MRTLFLLVALLVVGSASAAPFSGFYLSGGAGWDYYFLTLRESTPGSNFFSTTATGSGPRLMAMVGWNYPCGPVRLGGRFGYQAFFDDKSEFGFRNSAELRLNKRQGLFFDVTPGFSPASCLWLHLILGVGVTDYHLFGRVPNNRDIFRDEAKWSFLPRFGVGAGWQFWRCFSLGFEWTYTLPGHPVFWGPKQGPVGTDFNTRRIKVRSNQLALTLSWWIGQ